MANTMIEFEGVGKQYHLGSVGTGTLSHDLNRWWQTAVLRREDPYLKIGEVNDRSIKGTSDFVWALKDISFKVERGEVVGIIGKNGAGKSTLLKILSGITAPTTGTIRYQGRIASLLEVGTGFHPEMTGRENIYMNGSIMGMTKSEITRKLDEIVDFAGVERYLDTPVKRYSSGMTVRLGFAVAAFLEPEILVVDEVLTVGDAEFQKKAIGKMKDVSKGDGRTVLFVSHNMNAVKMLCNHGVVLKNGMIDYIGLASDCVDRYIISEATDIQAHCVVDKSYVPDFAIVNNVFYRQIDLNNANPGEIATDEPLDITLHLSRRVNYHGTFQLAIVIKNSEDVRVAYYLSKIITVPDTENFTYHIVIPHHALPKGHYRVNFEALLADWRNGTVPMHYVYDAIRFEVKYIHQEEKDEYLKWESLWATRLHNSDEFFAELVTKE